MDVTFKVQATKAKTKRTTSILSYFCIWCRIRVQLHSLHGDIQLSSTVHWRDCSFPIEWSWHPCWRLFDHLCEGLFLDCFFPPVVLYVCLYTSTVLIIVFQFRQCESYNYFSFSQLLCLFKVLGIWYEF